jgi:MFS family permease
VNIAEKRTAWRGWTDGFRRVRLRHTFGGAEVSDRIRRALGLFWLDGLLVSVSTSIAGNYLTLYALAFGATSTQIGLMSTVVSAASVLALLPGAHIAERWLDPKRMVLIFNRAAGQLVWAALGVLSLFLSGQPAVYGVMALRATRAFAVQAANASWTSLAGQIVPRTLRGKYFAARNIAKQGTALLLVPAAGWVIEALGFPTGYQVCFALATVVGILAFWTYARIPFDAPGTGVTPTTTPEDVPMWQAPAAKRNFWAFCGTSVVWAFSMQFAAPFFTVYLVEELGARAGIVGTLSAVASFTALPGQALFGRWLDRRGIKWTFRLSGLLVPLLPIGWLLVRGPWGALPIRFFAGFLMAGYNLSNFNMLLGVTSRHRRASQIALYRTVIQVANALAPLLGGLLVGRVGFYPVFVISGCGRFLSTLLLVLFVREPGSHPA